MSRAERERRALAAVFAGGAVARAAVAEALPHGAAGWPWGTFFVNVAGAALLAWVVARPPGAGYRQPFLGTGLCGALTTFSTLQLELLRLLDGGHAALAASYAAASVAAGLGAAWLVGRVARPGGRVA